jgi:hypothetical protein
MIELKCVKADCDGIATRDSIYCAQHERYPGVHSGPGMGGIRDSIQKQGELAAKATTDGESMQAELSVSETRTETWGEWFWRVTGRATTKRGEKPNVGVTGEIGAKW